jgi:hypothetical protein
MAIGGSCHCSKCRKVSGTDGNAVFYARADCFEWLSGRDAQTRFVVSGSDWATQFCRTCGSPLPAPSSDGAFYFVPAGLLDDDPGFRGYAAHIHVASKATWAVLTDSAPKYSEGFGSEIVADK